MEFEQLFPAASVSDKNAMMMMMLYGGSPLHEVGAQRYRYKDGLFHVDTTTEKGTTDVARMLRFHDPTGGIAFIAAEAAGVEWFFLRHLKSENRSCCFRHKGMQFVFDPKNGGRVSRPGFFYSIYLSLRYRQ